MVLANYERSRKCPRNVNAFFILFRQSEFLYDAALMTAFPHSEADYSQFPSRFSAGCRGE